MANILTTIETDIEAGLGVIKVLWQTATGEIETIVEADAKVLLGDVSTMTSKLLPDEYAVFKAHALPIVGDLFDGDFAKAETDVLNSLAAAGETFMTDMGSPLIQAMLGMIRAL